jgi:hypothetical protein
MTTQLNAATAGGTIVIAAGVKHEIVSAPANLASLTVTMPPSPADQDECTLQMNFGVPSGFVLNTSDGSSVSYQNPGSWVKNGARLFVYNQADTTWHTAL